MVSKTHYNAGDHVIYRAIGGAGPGTETSTTSGMIVDIITETQPAGDSGVSAHASDEEPRYLIKNDNTGKESAYKATNILEKINPAV